MTLTSMESAPSVQCSRNSSLTETWISRLCSKVKLSEPVFLLSGWTVVMSQSPQNMYWQNTMWDKDGGRLVAACVVTSCSDVLFCSFSCFHLYGEPH